MLSDISVTKLQCDITDVTINFERVLKYPVRSHGNLGISWRPGMSAVVASFATLPCAGCLRGSLIVISNLETNAGFVWNRASFESSMSNDQAA